METGPPTLFYILKGKSNMRITTMRSQYRAEYHRLLVQSFDHTREREPVHCIRCGFQTAQVKKFWINPGSELKNTQVDFYHIHRECSGCGYVQTSLWKQVACQRLTIEGIEQIARTLYSYQLRESILADIRKNQDERTNLERG